jgi:SAM-dependent methyltransferase
VARDAILSTMAPEALLEHLRSEEDARFDRVYPEPIRLLSRVFWTPISVARQAAGFLVTRPGTRVLDIGCGPGKFCIAAALASPGHFTGIEQRRRLCEVAWRVLRHAGIPNAEIFHGDMGGLRFDDFEAFYLFNPFAEYLEPEGRIDRSIGESDGHYDEFVRTVSDRLSARPTGTRVATYCGICEEIPPSYDCVGSSVDGKLRFWEKAR